MAPTPLSTGFQSYTLLPTIKLGPSGAGSRVGGLVQTPGPRGSLQRTTPQGWESLLLPPQPPRAFPIRGLRIYFPELVPWVVWSALLPTVCPVYLCVNVGLPGATRRSACPVLRHSESGPLSLSARMWGRRVCQWSTACPARLTLRQYRSRHGHESPLRPGCPTPPLLLVWMNVYFLFPWCRTSFQFDFLSVLVV